MKVIHHYLSCLMRKPTKWVLHTTKTQISLGIHPVWSKSSLSTWRKLESLAIHWAYSEDSDQTGRMPRLICVFAGRTCHFVGFVMRPLIFAVKELASPSLAVFLSVGSHLILHTALERVPVTLTVHYTRLKSEKEKIILHLQMTVITTCSSHWKL